MKLSYRLELLAQMCEKGKAMADVGTDHGFLPFYLLENQLFSHVYCCDISRQSLNKAVETFSNWGARFVQEGKVTFELADGLSDNIARNVDVAVFAGMGGTLIISLLNKISDENLPPFILAQPRNKPELIRKWVYNKGFTIDNEAYFIEGPRPCEIFKINTKCNNPSAHVTEKNNEIDLFFPYSILTAKGNLAQYLKRQKVRYTNVLKTLEDRTDNTSADERYRFFSELIDRINEMEDTLKRSMEAR